MKPKFRMFRRAGIYWVHDSETGRQQSLRTKKRAEAVRLLHGRNEAHAVPFANLQMARAYMMAADPAAAHCLQIRAPASPVDSSCFSMIHAGLRGPFGPSPR